MLDLTNEKANVQETLLSVCSFMLFFALLRLLLLAPLHSQERGDDLLGREAAWKQAEEDMMTRCQQLGGATFIMQHHRMRHQ